MKYLKVKLKFLSPRFDCACPPKFPSTKDSTISYQEFFAIKTSGMISVSNHEFVELRQQPMKTHFVFTEYSNIDLADLDIPEISSAKYQLKNGNAIGAYKKDSSHSSVASVTQNNKGKKIVAIASVAFALVLLGAGGKVLTLNFDPETYKKVYFRNSSGAPT